VTHLVNDSIIENADSYQ